MRETTHHPTIQFCQLETLACNESENIYQKEEIYIFSGKIRTETHIAGDSVSLCRNCKAEVSTFYLIYNKVLQRSVFF